MKTKRTVLFFLATLIGIFILIFSIVWQKNPLIPKVRASPGIVGFCPSCAQPGGLVPCGRYCDDPNTTGFCECYPCTLCHLGVLVKRVADFAIKNILIPIAILITVVGGVMFLTAGGSPEKVSNAKKIMTAMVIGFIIVLVAWLIVDTFIFFLTKGRSGGVATILGKKWSEIECPLCGDKKCDEPPETYENCPVDCLGFLWVPNSGDDTISQITLRDITIGGTSYTVGSVIKTYSTGDDPSRLTVMLGGDVWVGNRGDGKVTRLSPNRSDPPFYENKGSFSGASGARAVTYDALGNIWVGGYEQFVYKLDRTSGTRVGQVDLGAGHCSYGAIGDPFGYVWISDRWGGEVVSIDIRTNTIATRTAVTTDAYGIGIDNEGDIWIVEDANTGKFCQVYGANSGMMGVKGSCYFTGAGGGWGKARGIAVDGNNNVWVAASSNNTVYSFTQSGAFRCSKNLGSGGVVGVAPDAYNYVWAVVYDTPGRVYSLDQNCNIRSNTTVGNAPYNYSDMTGFRTVGCFIFE